MLFVLMKSFYKLSLYLFSTVSLLANPVSKTYFYVSTNDASVNAPIASCVLDCETGAISVVNTFEGVVAPSYLAVNAKGSRLYSVFEDTEGAIAAWRVDPASHALTLLGSVSSGGAHPCHLSLNSSGSALFAANYSSGTIGVIRIDPQGDLETLVQQIQHSGTGPNRERQEASHMHFIHSTLDDGLVLATDLGSDKVMLYQFDERSGELVPNANQAFLEVTPGAGPRHLAFHPNQTWVYLLNELNGTVETLYYNREHLTLGFHSSAELMPSGFEGYNKSAAVRVHPTGRFVYGSNRGDLNSITVFKVLDDGSLELVEVYAENIGWPRDFAIDPSGRFLLVGCREDDQVRVFQIDPNTGKLAGTGHFLTFPKPVCVLFPNP